MAGDQGGADRSATGSGEPTTAAGTGVTESGDLQAAGSGDRATAAGSGTEEAGRPESVGSSRSGDRKAYVESDSGASAGSPSPEAPAGSGDRRATASEREASDGSDDREASGVGGQFRRQRTALLTLGIIGAILIGFAIGVLARIPLNGSTEPDPGPVDVGFSQDMSAHHAQAVEMAGVLLVRSTDTEVRRLAYDILTTQQSQIGRMQGWLQLWGEPAQSVDGFMGWMAEPMSGHDHSGADTPHHSGPVSTMPGMATPAELAALRQATGPKLDTMFLQLMLRHHQGGLSMIDYAAQHADTTAVRTLAETMATTQRGESDLMTTMLTARGAAPLP